MEELSTILLVDGTRYQLWKPNNERVFSELVKDHLKDIFGPNHIYFDIEPKLRTEAGIGTKPDGILLILNDRPQLYIVEYELSTHPLHEHIVAQMSKFATALENIRTVKKIVDILYNNINKDPFKKAYFEAANIKHIHKFLFDLFEKEIRLVIIIDERNPDLDKAMKIWRSPFKIDIIEFRTFEHENVGIKIHAHLFNTIHMPPSFPTPAWNEFWKELLDRLFEAMPNIPKRPASKDRVQWLKIEKSIRIYYMHFEWWVHRRINGWFEIGLHFEKPKDATYNRNAIRWFMSQKDEIEQKLNESLYFEEKWGKTNARLYVKREFEGDILQISDEFKNWIINTTIKFYKFLKPKVKEYITINPYK